MKSMEMLWYDNSLALLVVLLLVEMQITRKKKIEKKNDTKTQHMLYFWKAGGSRIHLGTTYPKLKNS